MHTLLLTDDRQTDIERWGGGRVLSQCHRTKTRQEKQIRPDLGCNLNRTTLVYKTNIQELFKSGQSPNVWTSNPRILAMARETGQF